MAAGTVVEAGGAQGKELSVGFRRNQAASRGQHPAEIFRETFVNPQQIAFHRLLEIVRRQAFGPPILSIPRMDEFMRYQRRAHQMRDGIRQKILSRPVVARCVVLDAEVSDLVTHGQQEVILDIVRCTKQCSRFSNEPPVFVDNFRRGAQSVIRIGRNVEIMCRRSTWTQVDSAEVAPGEDR